MEVIFIWFVFKVSLKVEFYMKKKKKYHFIIYNRKKIIHVPQSFTILYESFWIVHMILNIEPSRDYFEDPNDEKIKNPYIIED